MITPGIALLISALSACIGAGISAAVLRSRHNQARVEQHKELSQQGRHTNTLHKENEGLRTQLQGLEKEKEHLRTLLGLPREEATFDVKRLEPALSEILAMKHVTQGVILSPQGFILHGDERDPYARSLAAALGIIAEEALWAKLDAVTLGDSLGQRITLHRIIDEQDMTQCFVGVWSRGSDIPVSAVARMRAMLGHPMNQSTPRGERLAQLSDREITQGGALARLVRDAPVTSLLASTSDDELLFKQGKRQHMWPEALLVSRSARFFAHRQAQGCGEFEEMVLHTGEDLTMLYHSRLPDETMVIVEAQFHRPTEAPRDAMRHAATQLGWHVKSAPALSSDQGVEDRRTPEARPSSTGAA